MNELLSTTFECEKSNIAIPSTLFCSFLILSLSIVSCEFSLPNTGPLNPEKDKSSIAATESDVKLIKWEAFEVTLVTEKFLMLNIA